MCGMGASCGYGAAFGGLGLHGQNAPSSEPRFGKDGSDASVVMTSWIRSECCVRYETWVLALLQGGCEMSMAVWALGLDGDYV